MELSSILAHRGLFHGDSDKNSAKALKRALDEGFGIETDLRDLDGEIIISHDPPNSATTPLHLEWLLEQISSTDCNSRIALNIKSDGLCELIASQIELWSVNWNRLFVFDMSVPDSLSYLKRAFPVYSRTSDYEPAPAFLEKANGIWVDNFKGHFSQVEHAKAFIDKGIRAAIVSPELHNRDHTYLWNQILDSGLHCSPLFELCTDFPMEAAKRFCEA